MTTEVTEKPVEQQQEEEQKIDGVKVTEDNVEVVEDVKPVEVKVVEKENVTIENVGAGSGTDSDSENDSVPELEAPDHAHEAAQAQVKYTVHESSAVSVVYSSLT